ncbi:MAG TPA: sugar transferase [Chloroflexota bacterium]|jgi:lipopolysaccharide/colanic/teichoic acid biosynthesis glycosyltransferase
MVMARVPGREAPDEPSPVAADAERPLDWHAEFARQQAEYAHEHASGPTHLDAIAKRALDVVGAAVLLLLLAPVFAVVAVLIRLDSPGPVLFRQQRVGRDGRPFVCLKFRSMRVDADQKVHAAYVAGRIRQGLPLLKLQADPRITRVGVFLRNTSIDELPQLWNVLGGAMSLVGPRPALAYEVELYDAQQRRRLLLQPGITGLAQVYSRGKGTLAEYVGHDLEYVAGRSFWQDVKILLITLPAVLKGHGAA